MRAVVGYGAIVAACSLVAVALLITKALLATVPVLLLTFLQLAASTLVVWSAAVPTGRLAAPRRLLRLSVPGLLQPGLAYVLTFLGLAKAPAGVAGLLFAFETPLVVLFAWPILKEGPRLATLFAAGAASGGVALLSVSGGSQGPTPMIAYALILGGVLAASMDTVLSRRLMIDADPLTLTAASHMSGLVVIGAALAIFPKGRLDVLFNPGALLLVLASGLLLHGAPTLLFNIGLARVEASRASIAFPLISVFTAAGACIAFGEHLSPTQVSGGAVVIAGALLARPGRRR